MNRNKRRPSNAIDGFVPRNRGGQTHRRPTLDDQTRESVDGGFAPRHTDAHQPMQISDGDANKEWSDENTIDFGDLEQLPKDKQRRIVEPGKPRWWQFGQKRRAKKGKPPLSRKQLIVRRVLLFIVVIALLIGGFLGWKFLRATGNVFDGNILGILSSTKLKGEDTGRVNILLAGNSADDIGHEGAKLTDSIMLVSINTKDNSAFMMSIPRDLYVDYGVRNCSVGFRGKINAAYVCGEQVNFSEPGYAEGGMGLLQKVVSQNFGVDINYYALVNYSAFREAVDAVGGISITIDSKDPRGIYDPNLDYTSRRCCAIAKYPNGKVTLDGKQALNLARARGDAAGSYGFSQGDFTRTQHQRQMLVALKDKTLSAGVLSNPAKISSLFDTIGRNVDTDFKTNEVRRLYDIGKKIESNNIKSIGLSDEDISLVTTDNIGGASVVVPTAGSTNFSQIKAFLAKLTSSDPLVREGAEIVVLNASGAIGLAQKRADILSDRGLNVVAVGNAASRQTNVVVDMSKGKNASTRSYLQKEFGVSATTASSDYPEAANYSDAKFIVILGSNSAPTTSN